jgi:predicted RNase H-like HicB family nuclease
MLIVARRFMKNEFTAIIERDGEWYIAYCPEIPGANGQGRTKDEARESLAKAIELILEDRREDALRGVPPDAIRETVTIK